MAAPPPPVVDADIPDLFTAPGVLRVAVVGLDYFVHRWSEDGRRTRLPVERITVAAVDNDHVVSTSGERIPRLFLGGAPLPPAGRALVPPLPPFRRVPFDDVKRLSGTRLPGAWYGLPLPGAIGDLDDAAWLTAAFRACGSLGPDNAVTRVAKFEVLAVEGLHAAGGAGEKAFLDVEYAKPDPTLHTRLFAKIPWAVDKGTLWRERISCAQDCDGREVSFYQFVGHALPVTVPALYFADLNRESTDYVLITERFDFPPADTRGVGVVASSRRATRARPRGRAGTPTSS